MHATTWMNFANIMLSEISQTKRSQYDPTFMKYLE